jgi:hypothetical protein
MTTHTPRTADVVVTFSYESWACRIEGWLPTGVDEILGVYTWFQGGGGVAETPHWDRWHDPDGSVGEGDALIDALHAASYAYFRVTIPNLPRTGIGSRHNPYYRTPHTFRLARAAIQYLQTHALDGKVTGSRDVTLPVDYRGYVAAGPSEGALVAAHLALAPGGVNRYDASRYRQSFRPDSYTADGSVIGAVLNAGPLEFRIYDPGISGAGIQHFGVSEAYAQDTLNAYTATADKGLVATQRTRWEQVSIEEMRDIGVIDTVLADYPQNRSKSFLVLGSEQTNEASYLRSGLTLTVPTALLTGTLTGAATIHTAVSGKGGTVKGFKLVDTTYYIYVEPNANTNVGLPDTTVTNDWTGTLTVKNGAGSSIATITTGYGYDGSDNYKTFKTRTQAVEQILDSDYARVLELSSPHPVDASALFKYARDIIFTRHGLESRDRYFLGNDYVASISGDDPALLWNDDTTIEDETIDWMQNELGMV